jgi:hypothetical protein
VQHGDGNVSGLRPGDAMVFELAPDERIRLPLRPSLVTVLFALKLRLRVLCRGVVTSAPTEPSLAFGSRLRTNAVRSASCDHEMCITSLELRS